MFKSIVKGAKESWMYRETCKKLGGKLDLTGYVYKLNEESSVVKGLI